MAITEFHGNYYFLSNFYPAPVTLDGATYPSVENAYQAAKNWDPLRRARCQVVSPATAKKLGKAGADATWTARKIDVMRALLVQKFAPGSVLAHKLLETGKEELVEKNWWGDRFWGVYKGEGENHLGKLLMEIRRELSA